jgi:hypothetical protein
MSRKKESIRDPAPMLLSVLHALAPAKKKKRVTFLTRASNSLGGATSFSLEKKKGGVWDWCSSLLTTASF